MDWNHDKKDITVLWQGDFEGGTLILFLSKKYDHIIFWKIFDPGFKEPLIGHYQFVASANFQIEKFIELCLETIRHTYFSFQQGVKDECISSGTKVQ